MGYFLGRDDALKALEQCNQMPISQLVAIKGRRRIGKSRLVMEYAKGKTLYKFEGLAPAPGVTAQAQRDEFARQLRQYFPDIPNLKANDWTELFELLAFRAQSGSVVILLDELSWMAKHDNTFLSKLKKAWDNHFKQNSKLMLILSSSISAWIEKNVLSSTGFLGRVNFVLHLKELSVEHCSGFWGNQAKHVSAYDQLKFFAVSGGVPLYLENINPKLPVEDNINRLCFQAGGLLLREFNHIFHDLFEQRSSIYKHILSVLIERPQSASEIATALNSDANGLLSEYLNDLEQASFISRDYTWHLPTGKTGKLSRYRLSDNYARFYLKYIAPRIEQIERNTIQRIEITSLPGWPSIMGLQFENTVLSSRALLWNQLGIMPHNIVMDGPYFQTQTKQHLGCQIDYMIQTRHNTLFVCEIKFSRHPVSKEVIQAMEEKIKRLKKPKGFSCIPVLIHVNGVADSIIDAGYFMHIVSFDAIVGH